MSFTIFVPNPLLLKELSAESWGNAVRSVIEHADPRFMTWITRMGVSDPEGELVRSARAVIVLDIFKVTARSTFCSDFPFLDG